MSVNQRELWAGRITIETGWAHYYGPVGDTKSHAHYATQLVFSPRIEIIGARIIPSGTRHMIRATQQPRHVLFIEPKIFDAIHSQLELTDQISSAQSWVELLRAQSGRVNSTRLEPVLTLAHGSIPPGYSAHDAADLLGLSRSHFSSVFRKTMGLPFRQWVLWKRLNQAVRMVLSGSDHTRAAYQAGFADSAHLARTMKRMFGIPLRATRLSVAPNDLLADM